MKVSVWVEQRKSRRSAFLVNANNTNVLLDYGVLLKREPIFPVHVRPKDVDAVVVTHAHLDHSGFVPSRFLSGNTKMQAIGTLPTFDCLGSYWKI